jgi:NAD(P)-dependent dehydrogenase (short-subunit alcohol dehydrogenase family)
MGKLNGKSAVVTGGSSGIGYATVEELKNHGAKVLFSGRNKESVTEASKKTGAIGVVSDQSDLSQIDKLVQLTGKELGKIDILVVNAGTFSMVPFQLVTEEYFDGMLDINLKGVYFTLQKFLPVLNDNASVVLISAAGTKSTGATGTSVYYITRAAINSMVRILCVELATRGIRINAVLPAAIDTPIFHKIGLPEDTLTYLMGTIKEAIPLKKIGKPQDIAHLVAFLASDEASFISGSEYMIDGGLSRKPIF